MKKIFCVETNHPHFKNDPYWFSTLDEAQNKAYKEDKAQITEVLVPDSIALIELEGFYKNVQTGSRYIRFIGGRKAVPFQIVVYRADNYYNDFGTLAGYFLRKEDAEQALDFSKEVKSAQGDFGQITEFTTGDFVDIKDQSRIHNEVWGEGDIVQNYYYV